MTTQPHNIARSILFIISLALAGCEGKTAQAPPKQMVQDSVRAGLPPFLSLDSIELEPIPTSPEAVKVNFKAIVTPKEELYQVDREVEGTPKVTLLKVLQPAGAKVSLYGSVEAHRTMDRWTLESPQILVGLKQFGAPRGAFDAQSYVAGTDEAKAALGQQTANAELQQRARKAALEQREIEQKAAREQEERERQARLEQTERERQTREEREEQARISLEAQRQKEMEQRKKEEEQRQEEEEIARQKLILATVAGTRYIGTITCDDQIQRLRLIFTEQQGLLIRADASNPDNPGQTQTFTGQLVFQPQPEKRGTVAYPIVLSPLGGEATYGKFYDSVNGSLKLLLTDTGLEGEANMGYTYAIRLQREGAPRATPPRATPPASW